jgi:hypothetical protein
MPAICITAEVLKAIADGFKEFSTFLFTHALNPNPLKPPATQVKLKGERQYNLVVFQFLIS